MKVLVVFLNQERALVIWASSVIFNFKPREGLFPALVMVGLEKEEALIIFLFIAELHKENVVICLDPLIEPSHSS